MPQIIVGTRGTKAVAERLVRDMPTGISRLYYHKKRKRKKREEYKIKRTQGGLQGLISQLS